MSTRRISSVAHVGNIAIGGDNPIRIQSMREHEEHLCSSEG